MPKHRSRIPENPYSSALRAPLGLWGLAIAVGLAIAPLGAHAQAPAADAIVAKAEPGIACVLVSRSNWFRDMALVKADQPAGKLGGFDFRDVDYLFSDRTDPNSNREKRLHFRSKYDLAYSLHIPESFGSGIVVDDRDLVLTNYHVVQDAAKVFVRLPGNKGSYADIWAADPRSDLAVLKLLDAGVRPLTPVPMGNADGVRRGQKVIALANPFAAGIHDGQPSVSMGVVSNLRRRVPGRQPLRELNANPLYQFGVLIQTDARIALGASGGALLNADGECIGITTSLAAVAGSDAPGGFALPVNTGVRRIIEILKKGEEIDYGFLGVGVEEEPAADGGAVVSNLTEGSPASVALRKEDIIVAIGPYPVRDNQDLMLALGLHFAGDRVALTIKRDGRQLKTNVTLVKYNVPGKTISSSLGNRPYVGGLRVDYTSVVVQGRNARQTITPGARVIDVQPESRAARAQLFKDDIITHVGGVPISTPAAFYEQVGRGAGPIHLIVVRGRQAENIRW
jgi:serine protease Do